MGIFPGEEIHAPTDKTTLEISLVMKFILFARIIFQAVKNFLIQMMKIYAFSISAVEVNCF